MDDIDDEDREDDRPAHQHAYVVTGVDTDTGEVLLMNPWEPTSDPVRLTEAELQDAMRRVDVSTLEEDS